MKRNKDLLRDVLFEFEGEKTGSYCCLKRRVWVKANGPKWGMFDFCVMQVLLLRWEMEPIG